MRLRIRHRLAYRFAEPSRNVTRVLRLTPRSFEGQHVVAWRIDIDVDCVLKAGEDGFGNLTHTFTAKGPIEELAIVVSGEIDNFDAAGIVRGSAERMPVELYLRETALTVADDALRRFAVETTGSDETRLSKLHGLMQDIHEQIVFDEGAEFAPSAADAFAARRGNGADLAHVFTACARHLGIPARVATGYYLCNDRKRGLAHSWSEAFVEGIGWIAFDPAHKVCPQEQHVRLATALDALSAAPVRGIGTEVVSTDLDIHAPFALDWTIGQRQEQGPGWQRQSQGGQSQSQG